MAGSGGRFDVGRGARMSLAAGLAALVWAVVSGPALGQVTVTWGATDIPRGECKSPKDLTVRTDRLAVAFAVGTTPSWGVPPGTVMDGALVRDGELQADKLVFFDFLPNGWTAWPQGEARLTVVESASNRAVVLVERSFGAMHVETRYTFLAGSDVIDVVSAVTNPAEAPSANLESGYSLVSHSGEVFSPGCRQGESTAQPEDPGIDARPAVPYVAGWATAYGGDWSISMVVPGTTICRGGSTYKDLFQGQNVAPGARKELRAQLYLLPGPDLSTPLAWAAGVDAAKVSGKAIEGDKSKGPSVVLFQRDGTLHSWALVQEGRFQTVLPPGRYLALAMTPEMKTAGPAEFDVSARQVIDNLDLVDVVDPGTLQVRATIAGASPPPAVRVRVEGGLAGGPLAWPKVAFSAAEKPGVVVMHLPAGEYRVFISYGAPFLSKEASTGTEILPGTETRLGVKLSLSVDLAPFGIACADLHHHSDQVDAKSPAELVALAQVASGLSFLFVSDHDTTVNHAVMLKLAESLGVPLIPSVEVSTSWGHFNIFPWPATVPWPLLGRDRTAKAIFEEARKQGADVQVNHPFAETSAYFLSDQQGLVPGGMDWGFQYAEWNGHDLLDASDLRTLQRLHEFWNQGKRYFLSGGSDNHDVLSGKADEVAGCIRTCVYGLKKPDVETFMRQLRGGHSFVTTGPTVVTDPLPGATVAMPSPGKPLDVLVLSPLGVKQVFVDSNSGQQELQVTEGKQRQELQVTSLPPGSTWVSIRAVDVMGNVAVTNPVWIK